MQEPAKDKAYALRLPVDLYEKLRAMAEREKRSLNQQIVYLLQKSVDEAA